MLKNIFILHKKTNVIFPLFIILIVLINISCEKELNSNSINNNKEIVVNGFINPDSIVKINVSFTYPENIDKPDTNNLFINNAICLLYENNTFIDTLNYTKNGFYICNNFKPATDNTYKLTIKVKGFKEINATTTIPKKVKFSVNLEKIYPLVYKGNITFKDPIGDTYFLFNILTKDTFKYSFEDVSHIEYSDGGLQYYFTNPDVGKSIEGQSFRNQNTFSDAKFKDKTYNLNIQRIEIYFDNDYLYFWLTTLNKDLYLNLKSKKKYDDVINDVFAEPVNIYSNINGGLGIFAGYNRAQDSLFFFSR